MIDTQEIETIIDQVDEVREGCQLSEQNAGKLHNVRNYLLMHLIACRQIEATGVCPTCHMPTRRTQGKP